MANMKEVVFVKIVNIILRESTVTNVNRSIIGHTESIGMKPMCANVRSFSIVSIRNNFFSCIFCFEKCVKKK